MAPTIDQVVDNATLSLHNLDVEKAASLSDLLGLAPVNNDVEKLSSVKTLQVIKFCSYFMLVKSLITISAAITKCNKEFKRLYFFNFCCRELMTRISMMRV